MFWSSFLFLRPLILSCFLERVVMWTIIRCTCVSMQTRTGQVIIVVDGGCSFFLPAPFCFFSKSLVIFWQVPIPVTSELQHTCQVYWLSSYVRHRMAGLEANCGWRELFSVVFCLEKLVFGQWNTSVLACFCFFWLLLELFKYLSRMFTSVM